MRAKPSARRDVVRLARERVRKSPSADASPLDSRARRGASCAPAADGRVTRRSELRVDLPDLGRIAGAQRQTFERRERVRIRTARAAAP
jgi:hypothetical protein